MFDTHTIARTLTDAGIDPKHADAITDAVRQAAEHGKHVTPERLGNRATPMKTLVEGID